MIVQLDFFRTREECERLELLRQFEDTKESSGRVRRACFAKIDVLAKENYELKCRLDILERYICTGIKWYSLKFTDNVYFYGVI